MNKCMICKADTGDLNEFICKECREAVIHYRNTLKFNYTTELDEIVFLAIYKEGHIDEIIDDFDFKNLKLEKEILHESIEECCKGSEWFLQQPGRLENFIKYVDRIIDEEAKKRGIL